SNTTVVYVDSRPAVNVTGSQPRRPHLPARSLADSEGRRSLSDPARWALIRPTQQLQPMPPVAHGEQGLGVDVAAEAHHLEAFAHVAGQGQALDLLGEAVLGFGVGAGQ